MLDYVKIETGKLRFSIEALEADVKLKDEVIESERKLIINKDAEQPKLQALYEQKNDTEAKISLMHQKICHLESLPFFILIASQNDNIVTHCYPMESRMECDAKKDIEGELECLPTNYELKLPDGEYIAIVVRKAKYDKRRISCKEILNDNNPSTDSYITSKAFEVKDGILIVKE